MSHGGNSPVTKYFHKKAELASIENSNRQETFKVSEGSISSSQKGSSDDEIIFTKKNTNRNLDSIVTPSEEEIIFATHSLKPLITVLSCLGSVNKKSRDDFRIYMRKIYDEIFPLIQALFEIKEAYSVAKLSPLSSDAYRDLTVKSIKLIYAFECVSFFPKKYPGRDFLQAFLLEAYLLRNNIALLSSKTVFSYAMKISRYYTNLAAAYTEIDLYNKTMKKEHGQTLHQDPRQEQESALKDKEMMDSLNSNARKYQYLHQQLECKRLLYHFEQTAHVNEKAKNYIRAIDELDKVYHCMSVSYVPFFNLLCKIGSLIVGLSIPDAQHEELLCIDLANHLLRLSQIYGDVIAKLPMKSTDDLPESCRPEHLAEIFTKCKAMVNTKREELQQAIAKVRKEKAKLETAAAITAVEHFFSGDGLGSDDYLLQESTTASSESSDSKSFLLNFLLTFDEETYSPPDSVPTDNPSNGHLVLPTTKQTEPPQDTSSTDDDFVNDVDKTSHCDLRDWLDYLTGSGGLFRRDQSKRRREHLLINHFNEETQQGIKQGAVSQSDTDYGHKVKRERGMTQSPC